MKVALLTLCFHLPWVHSLKEKRAICKSLQAKLRQRFNVAVAESGALDVHQTLELSVAGFAPGAAEADRFYEKVTDYALTQCDGELVGEERTLL